MVSFTIRVKQLYPFYKNDPQISAIEESQRNK